MKINDYSKENLKKIGNTAGYFVGIISGAIGIYEYLSEDQPNIYVYTIFRVVFIFSIAVAIAVSIIYAIKLFMSVDAVKIGCEKNLQSIFISLHKIFHSVRDCTSQIKRKKVDKEFLEASSKNICDAISELFQTIFNEQAAVCIKLTNTNSISNKDIDQWKLETIARSNSTNPDRSAYDSKDCYVKDNSDFYIIVSDSYKDNLFASQNLQNINDTFREVYHMEYRNSRTLENGTDYLEYYHSTIVVPIRIKRCNVSKILAMPEGIDYHILGFLCIDSMSEFDKNKTELFNSGIEIAKSLADSLYHLYESYLIREIEEKSANSKLKTEEEK